MQNKHYLWLGLGIVIAALLAGGILFLRPHTAVAPSANMPTASTTSSSSTTTNLGNGVSVTGSGHATVSLVQGVNPPPLTGPITISASLPPEAQAALRTQEQTLVAELTAAPTRVDLWLQLGVDRKIGGDYAGAAAAWEYVAQTAPTSLSYVAYGDLGDLYMNFDVNYPKAEQNYKQAIAINPHVIDYYKDLYTLYTSFYKTNTSAAANIVAQGLAANPGNSDLLQLKTSTQ